MYQRILVPVDGSGPSMAGIREAINIAKVSGATVQFIHVVNEYPAIQGGYFSSEVAHGLREQGQNVLTAAEAELKKEGVKCEKSALLDAFQGTISDLVSQRAKDWPADLIVIGTHGRRGLARLVIGSDAQSIIRSSRVPVLLVHGPEVKRSK